MESVGSIGGWLPAIPTPVAPTAYGVVDHGTWLHTDRIDLLAGALALAQADIKGAVKDADNPFFKSRYADLAGVWDACRPQLTKHGLSVVQLPITLPLAGSDGVVGDAVGLVTVLVHESGQWIGSKFGVTPKDSGAQATGSVLTYLRRYALSALVGVPQIDDDGEGAEGRTEGKAAPKAAKKPAPASPPAHTPGEDTHVPGEGVYVTKIVAKKGATWDARFITFSDRSEAAMFMGTDHAPTWLAMLELSERTKRTLLVDTEPSKKDPTKHTILALAWALQPDDDDPIL